MRNIVLAIYILLTNIYICTLPIVEYKAELIKKIKIGKNDGELLYVRELSPPQGPYSLFIANNDLIYVVDTMNSRLSIFNLNMQFIRNISYRDYPIAPYKLKFNNKNDIFLCDDLSGIMKIDNQDKMVYFLTNSELNIKYTTFHFQYYPIDDFIVYYNQNNEICIIDKNGKIIKNDVLNYLQNNSEGLYKGFIDENNEIYSKFLTFLTDNNFLFYNGKILLTMREDFKQYRNFCKQHNSLINKNDKKVIDLEATHFSNNFGTDKNGNYYWEAAYDEVIVFSKYGTIIDYFHCPDAAGNKTVASNGDVYIMKSKDDGIYFFKIKNVWDSIDSLDTATPSTIPQVTSLTASSYNPYKNMYTPLKAFDGDINTAWLEAAKGPGIGETITLELDKEITIDSIRVLPGYFDAKWWKSNNRVKSLIMKTDDSTTTLQFQDAMKPHKADFKEPKTFKKVEFIIKEVYPSGKDDDTAISEIQFYYKGERIQLDFSKQEAELRNSE